MALKSAIFGIRSTRCYARQLDGRYLATKVPPVQLQAIEPPVGTVPEAKAAPPLVGVKNIVLVPEGAMAVV